MIMMMRGGAPREQHRGFNLVPMPLSHPSPLSAPLSAWHVSCFDLSLFFSVSLISPLLLTWFFCFLHITLWWYRFSMPQVHSACFRQVEPIPTWVVGPTIVQAVSYRFQSLLAPHNGCACYLERLVYHRSQESSRQLWFLGPLCNWWWWCKQGCSISQSVLQIVGNLPLGGFPNQNLRGRFVGQSKPTVLLLHLLMTVTKCPIFLKLQKSTLHILSLSIPFLPVTNRCPVQSNPLYPNCGNQGAFPSSL